MVLRALRAFLSNTCHDRWTGRGGPTAWPPRSTSDFNPLNLYLWEHLHTLEYGAPVDDEETSHRRTVDACQTIRNCPDIFARMWRSMMRRVEACTEPHRRHSDRLL
jgi:hypothetical protein